MGITRPRPAYAIALFLLGVGLLAYLTVRFVSRREQTAIDSGIVADLNPLIEAKLRSLAADGTVLAGCGEFQSWQPENWGRFSTPMQPRLFINGTVHFQKADFGCIVTVVGGPLNLSLRRQLDDKQLLENPRPAVAMLGFIGEASHPAFVPE